MFMALKSPLAKIKLVPHDCKNKQQKQHNYRTKTRIEETPETLQHSKGWNGRHGTKAYPSFLPLLRHTFVFLKFGSCVCYGNMQHKGVYIEVGCGINSGLERDSYDTNSGRKRIAQSTPTKERLAADSRASRNGPGARILGDEIWLLETGSSGSNVSGNPPL